jgi:hypothetical protein
MKSKGNRYNEMVSCVIGFCFFGRDIVDAFSSYLYSFLIYIIYFNDYLEWKCFRYIRDRYAPSKF